MLLKSRLKVALFSFLIALAGIQPAIGQTSPTRDLRNQIINDLATNNARQISAEKLRAVFLSSAKAIDSVSSTVSAIFNTFSLGSGIGEYDASTGIATVKATGSTSTPDTIPVFADGKYFDVVKGGTRSITGTAINMVPGAKIIVRGTVWSYIPPSDAAFQRTIALDANIDDLYKSTTGRLVRNLPVPLTFTRSLLTGVATTPGNMGQVENLDRSVAVTGFSDVVNTSMITDMQTGVPSAGLTKISLDYTPTSFVTADPSFGVGFVSGADRVIFVWRNTGQLSFVKAGTSTITTIMAADLSRDYTTGQHVRIDLIPGVSATTINLIIEGSQVATINSSSLPTGDIIIGARGSMSLVYSLSTDQNSGIPAALSTAKSYTDTQLTSVNDHLTSLDSKVIISATAMMGKVTPVDGVASGTTRTRFSLQAIPVLSGTIKISELKVRVAVAGVGKVKILSPNGSFYAEQYSLSHTFVVGENTLPGTLFASWNLSSGWFIAFEGTGTMQFSDVVGSTSLSRSIIGDVTSVASTTSLYDLQYRADLATTSSVKDLVVQNATDISTIKQATFYVSDALGSDLNNGLSDAAAFKTINKAILSCAGRTGATIIISGGDYYEALDMTMILSESIRLTSKNNAVVRVLGSQKLTGWIKTTGRTNIYEADFAGTIPAWAHTTDGLPRIFEDKNPSKLITDAEVHPLQRGLVYRLPYTEIAQIAAGADLAATLTSLDASPGKYYLSAGKLYLNASGSTNPTSNGFDYHIPVRVTNTVPSFSNTAALGRVAYENLRFMFSTSGLISSGFATVTRINCVALGVVSTNGGFRDDGAHVISYRDEAGGCSNDGFNQHYDLYNGSQPGNDLRRSVGISIYYNPWAHDNGDDGMSGHIRSEVTVYGGLAEYNPGGGGFTPANGGSYTVYDALARNNSIGFSMANSSAGTGRNHTTLLAVNCTAVNNVAGFQNNSESGAIMELRNCVARQSTVMNFRATAAGAVINAYNCLSSHTDSLKHKTTSPGTINIINDPVLAP
ncbi:hypothetical protein [Dyadobacter sp. CY323]|uniref:hypothetical protein n=1 Tax=Dyadobacter sp. CY323 TaxID=2907302 RepID=UPI001F34D7EC|nr:hypothetical protein [Dyadobacter sp. CY323]MCE6987487.1 hypothetical protein [Dyadobacter sp. CY323]